MAFSALFVSTFVARDQLNERARSYVTQKTVDHAARVVDLAERALQTPTVQKILAREQREAVARELDAFREDPFAFVQDLTRAPPGAPRPGKRLLAIGDRVTRWKETVRQYFDETLARLVSDLRIFLGSNIAASVTICCVAFAARGRLERQLTTLSLLLCAVLAYAVFLYVDNLSFFRILLRWHLGWSYPILLLVLFVGLFLVFRRQEQRDTLGMTPPKS